jgi:hypothetical protein
MAGRWDRLAPVTGIVAVVLSVVAFIVGGETPDADASAREAVSYYTSNDTEIGIASTLLALGAAFYAFFVAVLVGRLRRAGQADALSAGTLIGGALMTTGMLIFAGIGLTLSDVGGDLDPAAVQTLNALNSDFFFPVAGGTVVLSWCLALTVLKTGGLPRPLGWVGLVIAIASVTPAGFFAFLALGLWAGVSSLVMLMQPETPLGREPTGP